MITNPGVYQIPSEEYHADPCDTPSLSAGMITQILDAPAKCFWDSPRLNPDYEEHPSPDKCSLGTVRHIMFLEPHLFNEKVVVIDADDWRKKESQASRAAAKEEGKTPILAHQFEKVKAARRAFYKNDFVSVAFEGGKFEQSMFWRHPAYGIWCRARPDFIHDSGAHLCDYKATGDANPAQFGRHAWNMAYHRRAAWYLEGAEILFGKRPQHYWFINQENDPPYLVSVCELDQNALEAGQQENDRAARIFLKCLTTGDWPGYRNSAFPDRDTAFQTTLPNYAYIQIDERNFA